MVYWVPPQLFFWFIYSGYYELAFLSVGNTL